MSTYNWCCCWNSDILSQGSYSKKAYFLIQHSNPTHDFPTLSWNTPYLPPSVCFLLIKFELWNLSVFLKFNVHANLLESCYKADYSDWGVGGGKKRFCMFNKHLVMLKLLVSGTLWVTGTYFEYHLWIYYKDTNGKFCNSLVLWVWEMGLDWLCRQTGGRDVE